MSVNSGTRDTDCVHAPNHNFKAHASHPFPPPSLPLQKRTSVTEDCSREALDASFQTDCFTNAKTMVFVFALAAATKML